MWLVVVLSIIGGPVPGERKHDSVGRLPAEAKHGAGFLCFALATQALGWCDIKKAPECILGKILDVMFALWRHLVAPTRHCQWFSEAHHFWFGVRVGHDRHCCVGVDI